MDRSNLRHILNDQSFDQACLFFPLTDEGQSSLRIGIQVRANFLGHGPTGRNLVSQQ
jgi:hypothetical protein